MILRVSKKQQQRLALYLLADFHVSLVCRSHGRQGQVVDFYSKEVISMSSSLVMVLKGAGSRIYEIKKLIVAFYLFAVFTFAS